MKPLGRDQTAFKTEQITYLDRKSILLDRMLLRFFELLRYDGRKVYRRQTRTIDVENLIQLMTGPSSGRFPGFAEHADIARTWLRGDLLEIMNRGRPDAEMVVGPRPFHLNAFKLTNRQAVQDYGASEQIWAMIYHADRPLLDQLREFFGKGLDRALDRYDQSTGLDLETLAVLGLADNVAVSPATEPPPEPIRPLCTAQGRILADDLRRLLAYDGVVPRHVLAGYLRTAMGLHLALLMLRLVRLVPSLVSAAASGSPAPACAAEHASDPSCHDCPFGFEIVVDLTDDPLSGPAQLARASAAEHFARIPEYVRAVFLVNRLKDYARVQAASGRRARAETLDDLLATLRDPPADLDGFFAARIADVLVSPDSEDEDEDPVVKEIVGLDLPALDRFVELVCLQRLRLEAKRVMDLLDSLSQKNRPGGFLRQTAGARARRWFTLDSHLLETLVHIAVVGRREGAPLSSRIVLVDEFVTWLRDRYGFVAYAPDFRAVHPEEHEAWQRNEQALRERLHEIGFFVDLSDAYNSQTLRPRYEVNLG
jgi:hypothetical protein